VCVERVSAMCTAGMPRSRSVALEGRLVGCLYKAQISNCMVALKKLLTKNHEKTAFVQK
jgi:hypothetical protein